LGLNLPNNTAANPLSLHQWLLDVNGYHETSTGRHMINMEHLERFNLCIKTFEYVSQGAFGLTEVSPIPHYIMSFPCGNNHKTIRQLLGNLDHLMPQYTTDGSFEVVLQMTGYYQYPYIGQSYHPIIGKATCYDDMGHYFNHETILNITTGQCSPSCATIDCEKMTCDTIKCEPLLEDEQYIKLKVLVDHQNKLSLTSAMLHKIQIDSLDKE
jgi:hypothetical protein